MSKKLKSLFVLIFLLLPLFYSCSGETNNNGNDASTNEEVTTGNCGNLVCEPDENCNNCVNDCGCKSGEVCTDVGLCCVPDCEGKECGSDGCGGSCGSCGVGKKCENGKCVDWAGCGDGVCYAGENCENCPEDCGCELGKICLPGGSCGECVNDGNCIALGMWEGKINSKCVSGKCVCTPFTCQEIGAECGVHPDGCGGTIDCGGCNEFENSFCNHGVCNCKPHIP